MKNPGRDKEQKFSGRKLYAIKETEKIDVEATPSETSPLVEVYLTETFLKDLFDIAGMSLGMREALKVDSSDFNESVDELVCECVMNDHLSEQVTPEIKVLRFGALNEVSIYYTQVKHVVRTDNTRVYFKKYAFVKATVGQKRIDNKSSKLNKLGKTLTKIMMIGAVLNRAHVALEKIKDLAQNMITSE